MKVVADEKSSPASNEVENEFEVEGKDGVDVSEEVLAQEVTCRGEAGEAEDRQLERRFALHLQVCQGR